MNNATKFGCFKSKDMQNVDYIERSITSRSVDSMQLLVVNVVI